MRKSLIRALICSAALMSVISVASAQRYSLDDYLDRNINEVKDSLRDQGYDDVGHITKRSGTWALMYDGRNCIALHGGRGVIDDIDTFDRRDCERQDRDRPRRRG